MSISTTKDKSVTYRWGRYTALSLVVVAAATVVLVAMIPSTSPPLPPLEDPRVNVEVRTVESIARLADTFVTTGVVEANRVVKVAAEVPGRIERFGAHSEAIKRDGMQLGVGNMLEEGEPVVAGDPLVHLNRELLQARYDRAQAQLEFDETEFTRISTLYEEGTASKTEYDDKRTQRAISQAVLNEAAEELKRTVVTAPISGILNKLPMEIGEYASPGMCVAEIVDVSKAKVVVDIPERDVCFLAVGDKGTITIQSPEAVTLVGEITYISELADSQTRTTRVEIIIDNPNRELRSGRIVRATLTRRVLENVVMVPLSTIVPMETEKAVYVVNDSDQAERRMVELGLLKGRSVEITHGLNPGDRLIVAGHRYVSPGQQVTIVEHREQ